LNSNPLFHGFMSIVRRYRQTTHRLCDSHSADFLQPAKLIGISHKEDPAKAFCIDIKDLAIDRQAISPVYERRLSADYCALSRNFTVKLAIQAQQHFGYGRPSLDGMFSGGSLAAAVGNGNYILMEQRFHHRCVTCPYHMKKPVQKCLLLFKRNRTP